MTEPTELLPCPFCGHCGPLDYQDGSTCRWGVASCASCGASAGETRRKYPDTGDWHKDAIAQWNSRAPVAAPLEPTDDEIDAVVQACRERGLRELDVFRAVLAKWGTPQQEAQEPCPTCIALARTVMLDHVSFDRKPDCYGIRQITDDEGVEEWEDIRTSPDVAREEANDMMATGRGEIYEVVPLWTTPQPTQAQAGAVPLTCEWAHNEDDGFWDAECGQSWRFDDGGPKENHMNFCHCCGKPLRIKGGQHGAE